MSDTDVPPRTDGQHHPKSVPLYAWHDWSSSRPVTGTILTAVAKVHGVDVTELSPLHEYIDPDALDRLFRPTLDGTPRGYGCIRFRYDDSIVSVTADGEITVRLRDGPGGVDRV